MALVKCPECGREISSVAKFCPHCGFPMENKEVTVADENLVSLYSFTLQKSCGNLVGLFIIVELLIAILMGLSFIGFYVYVIYGAAFFCTILEVSAVVGMISDIVKYKKLNSLIGKELKYDSTKKALIFEDINHANYVIPLDKVIQIDGPFTMVITYIDSFSKAKKKAIIGNTCKEDVIYLRKRVNALRG